MFYGPSSSPKNSNWGTKTPQVSNGFKRRPPPAPAIHFNCCPLLNWPIFIYLSKTSWHLDIFKSKKFTRHWNFCPATTFSHRKRSHPKRLRFCATMPDFRLTLVFCWGFSIPYPFRSACQDVIWSTLRVEFMSGADNKKHLLHRNPKHLKISPKCLVNWVVGHLFGWFHLNHTPGSLNHGKVMICEPWKKKLTFHWILVV